MEALLAKVGEGRRQTATGLIYNIDRTMYFYVCIQKTPQEKLALMKMLQACMEEDDKRSEEMAGTFLGDARNDVRELTEAFMTSLDDKMGDYLSDMETKKDEYHWDADQCDDLRGEIISLFNYQNICRNEVGTVDEEDFDETESENEDAKTLLSLAGSKQKAVPKKRGRSPTKETKTSSSSSSSSEPVKKIGRPTKNPNGKPVSYVVEIGTKIFYEGNQYIVVDARVGGPGMCQIGVSKKGEKQIVEYDESRGHVKKAMASYFLRKGATIYES